MMTPQQARQEIEKNDKRRKELKDELLKLDNADADLFRIVNGDVLGDAHNAEQERQWVERENYMMQYYSKEAKQKRAAEENAQETQRQETRVSARKAREDAEWERVLEMNKRLP